MSSGNSSAASPIRILRAIEETADNETIETRDFQVSITALKRALILDPSGVLKVIGCLVTDGWE